MRILRFLSKTLALSLLPFFVLSCSSDESPPPANAGYVWTAIVSDGFGISSQNTVPEMKVFGRYLYASTSPKDTGLAKLYRSASGDAGTWSEISIPLSGDKSIHSFGATELGEGYLWCGTGSANGAMIFRTQDGLNWIPIANRGFGNPLLTGASPHLVVFKGSADSQSYLYAGMGSHGDATSGQVWRIPYNSSSPADWSKLMDFSGPDPLVKTITYFFVWNNTLYFATDAGGQLWQTNDGTHFTKNAGVGNGFNDTTNKVISSLEVFNNKLYATTNNPIKGGQIWRTADGSSWEKVTGDAFGKGKEVIELRSIRASFGRLWVTGYTDTSLSKGTPIWYSTDGTTWTQSNADGFGDPQNNGQNAVTIGFGDYQYFGGPNYTKGGQIWRLKIQ